MRPLFPLLAALCASVSCFSPEYHCRIICTAQSQRCPEGYFCDQSAELCSLSTRPQGCSAGPPVADAGAETRTDVSLPDAPEPDAPAADAGQAPEQLCYAGACFTLGPELRQALVLWLDPSTLPAAGTSVARWADRSGQGNDALAVSGQALPHSRGDGLQMTEQPGGSLRVLHDPSLNFGADDFTVMVVARFRSSPPSCLYKKGLASRPVPQGVLLEWGYSVPLTTTTPQAIVNSTVIDSARRGLGDQQPHVLALRRTGASAELRVDGEPTAIGALSPPEQSTSTDDHVFLGACGAPSIPVPVLHAVVVLRGRVPDSDVPLLEGYLLQAFPRTP